MSLYINNGTTNIKVKKRYKSDGTAFKQVKKRYKSNSTSLQMTYSYSLNIIPDTDGVNAYPGQTSPMDIWFNTGSTVNAGGSTNKINTRGWNYLVFDVQAVGDYADRWVNAGLGTTKGADPNVTYIGIATAPGIYKLDISNYQGDYYVCMRGRWAPYFVLNAMYLE